MDISNVEDKFARIFFGDLSQTVCDILEAFRVALMINSSEDSDNWSLDILIARLRCGG